ncbi:flagellar hook-associated protein FlgK [Gayadomonas joobiniege]|uniref:flagellar hook-associated protein FlgK n=1 Tax=Gayadomonas joobiniege TaxID=1234606 RepID=UPI0003711300|nr:flagellar hook-associated protein FlgK [Gayadomonas joobiniege]
MTDLLKIGSSALLGNQSLLATTSNNIANVNTPGYTRQRTEFSNYVEWGVGRSEVVRMYNSYAVDQLRRDTSVNSKSETLASNTSNLENLFSDESLSYGDDLNNVFEHLNQANDDPQNLVPRDLFISDANALFNNLENLTERLLQQQKHVNQEIKGQTSETNSLISGIFNLNDKIVADKKASINGQASPELLDERNELVRKLAEKMNISVLEDDAGHYQISTANGQSLVTNGTYYQLETRTGNPDPAALEYNLVQADNPKVVRSFDTDGLSGEIGGLISYRSDTLNPAINSLGKLALTFADAMNEQNKKGLTAEGEIGQDLFSLPVTNALGYQGNSSANHLVQAQVVPGQGSQITNFDYQIEFTSASEYTVQAYDGSDPVGGVSGPFSFGQNPANFQNPVDGIQFSFQADGSFVEGDTFMVRPTRLQGNPVETLISRPEDLALAAPVAVNQNNSNLGSARIELTDVSTTDPSISGFDQNGLKQSAPAEIIYTENDTYQVRDTQGNILGEASDGEQIMKQLRDNGSFPVVSLGGSYPGYEISISGTPEPGDSFSLTFNEDASHDNFNGLLLADLQQQNTVRADSSGQAEANQTFSESYAQLVGQVGNQAREANMAFESSSTLLQQSELRVEEASGVNLDEEAADLLRYEQAYNASARIISVSQTLFDSLLAAVG